MLVPWTPSAWFPSRGRSSAIQCELSTKITTGPDERPVQDGVDVRWLDVCEQGRELPDKRPEAVVVGLARQPGIDVFPHERALGHLARLGLAFEPLVELVVDHDLDPVHSRHDYTLRVEDV